MDLGVEEEVERHALPLVPWLEPNAFVPLVGRAESRPRPPKQLPVWSPQELIGLHPGEVHPLYGRRRVPAVQRLEHVQVAQGNVMHPCGDIVGVHPVLAVVLGAETLRRGEDA